ncbi:TetR/AcrR family transcriptional regulator [Xanthobacter agilis]|jgi:AcrR family transcriptional regulator|uniref:AcrR family transcriptional regulator n=1 Tax=Xanthobacter agilis TaxID=47492 RepID=A0ABU0L8X1_XANAG|nr:TetR/AcrR family transcriptional regulator [Xanthobacter agilis]MDQ0503560.1 AcrR family transcriptional regulator [Xanthobacter agilis]
MRSARSVKAHDVDHSAPSSVRLGRGPGRPKTLPDAAQRALIVGGAYRLFVRTGYGGTTMDAVAAECRMSKRTLYRFFPGKADLFAAVVDAHRQSMLATPRDDAHSSLADTLEAIFRIDISPEEDRARCALLRLVQLEGPQHPELMDILERMGADRSRAELAAWLAAQGAAGRLVLDDADAMARILMDMVFGAALPKANGVIDWPPPEARRAHVRRCVRLFLNGAVPRP